VKRIIVLFSFEMFFTTQKNHSKLQGRTGNLFLNSINNYRGKRANLGKMVKVSKENILKKNF